MKNYNPESIELKWQKIWDEESAFLAEDFSEKEKYYVLGEFPYPSGDGLHVGHARPYTALDIISRKKRAENYNVLFPMGWDAFGLPTENYAIQNKVHPAKVTEENIANFKNQLQRIGYSFDWTREINTTDPKYYKWTQWMFFKFFEHGLAYKEEMPINWCTSCLIGLANEEVVNGACERCGGEVEEKVKNQWMIKITAYADRLIDDLEDLDYINSVKTQQINWIGRSYGVEINFEFKDLDEKLKVYTTRPDTIYGATYMVIAPEHPIIEKYKDRIENYKELEEYKKEVSKKSHIERTDATKEKSGVMIEGIKCINPLSGSEMTIWVSDYVLMGYGTGAIMAVPAHDERDWDFANKYSLPIIKVIDNKEDIQGPYCEEEGKVINSEVINDLNVKEAQEKMTEYIIENGLGERKTNYSLRDWVFSRQRYWGEPIPLVYCKEHQWVPVPEEELPVLLPDVENYEPNHHGDSPLADIRDWVETTCPICGGYAERETDTMPNWAGSSWYFLRYIDPNNDEEFASRELLDYWMPVDWYNGGMEHTTLHLLYSRFWHKFFYDIGYVPGSEPYQKRTAHGMILGEGNVKMSKSLGNVINPLEIVDEFGADTLRAYEMFIGDFEKSAAWSEAGVRGIRRFLERVWHLQEIVNNEEEYSEELEVKLNKTIQKISKDFDTLKFNTGIAALMELLNGFNDLGQVTRKEMKVFLQLLNPVTPHITEEIWENLGFEGRIFESDWPEFDESKLIEDVIELPVQVNGRVRATITVERDISEDDLKEIVKKEQNVLNHTKDKEIIKEIYIPGRIYNIVVK